MSSLETIGELIRFLNENGACGDSLEWLRRLDSSRPSQEAWDGCLRGDWLMWLVTYDAVAEFIPKRFVPQLCCDIAKLALPEWEKMVHPGLPLHKMPRAALEAYKRSAVEGNVHRAGIRDLNLLMGSDQAERTDDRAARTAVRSVGYALNADLLGVYNTAEDSYTYGGETYDPVARRFKFHTLAANIVRSWVDWDEMRTALCKVAETKEGV